MKKNMIKLLLTFIIVSTFSSCSISVINGISFFGKDTVFDPAQVNYIKEPDYLDFEPQRIWYDYLCEKEQQAYRKILNCVAEHPSKILLPVLTEEELERVYSAVKNDNPYLLCLSNVYSYYQKGSTYYLLPEYIESADECNAHTLQTLEQAKKTVRGMPDTPDEYARELYLHDTLIEQVCYRQTEYASDAYGTLIQHNAVCGGYARAYKYLLDLAGLKSFVVSGKTGDDSGNDIGHTWVCVNIQGQWYHVDPTWDDPVTDSDLMVVRHNYFNLTDDEIALTHSDFVMPEKIVCNDRENNYYIKTGAYCTRTDWYTVINDIVSNAMENLPSQTEIRFEDGLLFNEAMITLFDNEGIQELIADVLRNNNQKQEILISHSSDDAMNIIHIYLDKN